MVIRRNELLKSLRPIFLGCLAASALFGLARANPTGGSYVSGQGNGTISGMGTNNVIITKTEVAKRIYSLRSVYLSKQERKMLEDFLHMLNNKKEKRIRKNIPK